MKRQIKAGLCEGRHTIPGVEVFIYPTTLNPLDVEGLLETARTFVRETAPSRLDLYVTGLTVACLSVVKACHEAGVALTCWHFDRESGDYYPQPL